MKYVVVIVLFFVMLAPGCSRNPYKETNKSYRKQTKTFAKLLEMQPKEPPGDSLKAGPWWVGTTNFNMRKPNFVIIHHTAQNSCDQTLQTFTRVSAQVSAHYVICRDGTVHHMLNDWLRAWHAGAGKWGNNTDINSSSIGIEIDNNGFEPFSEQQINSLLKLLGRLKQNYTIPVANFIGHADIAPGRKVDPSRFFPWKFLSEHGFGVWYDTAATAVPADFNPLQALRIIGYDTRKQAEAIQSFKIHFSPADTSNVINDGDRKILYELEQKSR